MAVRLSVVVPVYGTEKYLRRCLDSLAEQTLRDAEFILVDDASPDRSGFIMASYAAKDARFRIVRHDANRGLYASRLTGAAQARGEYLAFLDSDDYVSVDFYRAAADRADEGSYDVVMGDTVWEMEDGRRVVRPVHECCVMADVLSGDDVRRAFYAQELSCYSWHTIWNKVWRRSLFERCRPQLERLDAHVIMCEDVAFSAVLLYEARSLARIHGDGVFYCMHAASSTGAAYADAKRFFKNYTDIVTVFEFVESFLQDKRDGEALAHLMNARRWYARMWTGARQTCAPSGAAKKRADALTARLAPGFDADDSCDNGEIWWFDRQTIPWNDGLERIKRAIAGLEGFSPETVSFDVFDTLIQRPFRQPTDLFSMLEDKWQQTNRRCMLSFAEARAEAENLARAAGKETKADVNLDDIYRALCRTWGVSEDCAEAMCVAEREAEIAYCQPRRTGVQLHRLARAMGRRVVLTSDMYLDSETIACMLKRCGVAEWDGFFLSNEQNVLKWNGGLYRRVLDSLNAQPQTVLHIGDNWENDFIQPRKLGLHAMHHPRAMDVMTDYRRTQLGTLGQQTAASFGGGQSLQASLSFRCMQALTANRFFDNGFAATSPDSSFSCSPALWGYYAVGGHVLSLAQWLIRRARADGVRKLVFLARDGWLVKQAVDCLLSAEDGITTVYKPASRRCLLPALAVNPCDFYALPINIPAYSAGKLVRLLSFCTAEEDEAAMRAAAETAGFSWDAPFTGRHQYIAFIRWYLDNLYDGARHQKAYNDLAEYYAPVFTEGAACFDMGYSGRLQAALNQLACRSVPVYFVHSDEKDCPRLERAYGFEARCFYPMKPGMSGAFREFLLSSDEPPCIGFRRTEQGVVPVYGRSEYNMAARFFVATVQRNALQFVRDYSERFAGTTVEYLSGVVCSMPFESALRYLTEADIDLLTHIRFEDIVFASRDDLDLAALVRDQAGAVNAEGFAALRDFVSGTAEPGLTLRRACKMLRHDRGALKAEAKELLRDHPRLTSACRAGWHVLRRCRRMLKGEKS